MGANTTYKHFYKPALGASGATELATYDAKIDRIDIFLQVDCANYDNPDDAITAIGASNKTLLVTETETCDTNFTVPANVMVKFERGGKWTINTGITVTFNGQIDAGLWQIFEYVGTGTLAGTLNVKEVYPQWWGASPSASAAVNATAFANTLLRGRSIRIPTGNYSFDTGINIPANIQVIGDGANKTILTYTGSGSYAISLGGTSIIENLQIIQTTDTTPERAGLYIGTNLNKVLHIEVNGFRYGIKLEDDDATGVAWNEIYLDKSRNCFYVIYLTAVGANWVNENHFWGGDLSTISANVNAYCIYITGSGTPNGNKFFGVATEDYNGVYCDGVYNDFVSMRYENTGTDFYWGSNSLYNIVIGGNSPGENPNIIDNSTGTNQFITSKLFSQANLPNTTFVTKKNGIIYKNTSPFIHDFNYGNNGTVTTEGHNTFVGVNAGNLTMGSTATATGESSYNTIIGNAAFTVNTKGNDNSAVGTGVLNANTTGSGNTTIGSYSLGLNTTGSQNVAIGKYGSYYNTTGSQNVVIGYLAGTYHADASTPLTDPENSIYIGYRARGKDNNDNNSIVIGYETIGLGANTVVLGNDSITKTILKGNVMIGLNANTPTARLHLAAGTATASTAPLKFISGTLLTTPEVGAVEFLTDKFYGTITTGAVRKTFAFLESPVFTGSISIPEKTPVNAIASQGTITMAGIATANETFVIDSQTFTWKAARAAAGEVTIGADAPAAVTNIVTAVTADLATVTAVDGTGDTVTITAVTKGVAGNSIVFTEASTNMTVDGAGTLGTTTAGVNGTVGVANEIAQDATYFYVCVATNTVADTNWRRIALGSAY